ncbi:MAG: hypothetical protein ABSH52_31220 [Terriglobia bacterium]|jgi:hypothetical protein
MARDPQIQHIPQLTLMQGKSVANQGSQPEIYHLYFVRVRAVAAVPEGNLSVPWPISANHWPISGTVSEAQVYAAPDWNAFE